MVLRTDIQTEMETQITLNLVVSPMLVDTLLSWLGSVAYSSWRKKQEVKKNKKNKKKTAIRHRLNRKLVGQCVVV